MTTRSTTVQDLSARPGAPGADAAGRAALARARPSGRDERLAGRAARGDEHAFAELYRRHHQRLYRYCLSLLGDPDDAADALQSTMARALSALERGDVIKGVRPWLFRIAHNAAIDLVRQRRPRAPVDEIDEIEASALTVPSADSEAESRSEFAQVVSDIRELPERQGSALVMRELSELSYAEIAGALDTSPLAARQLVHQARSRLYDSRDGRAMDCESVRRGLGETDGKRPRGRKLRAHLAGCEGCEAFGRSIRKRRSALAAAAPPLAPLAASEILARLLSSSPASGAGLAGGGLAAGAAEVGGASAIVKVAATAVAGTAAAVAVGGAVVAGGALLGSGDADSRGTQPGATQASLVPDLPALQRMPEASGSGPAEPSSSPAGPSGDGLPPGPAQSEPEDDLSAAEAGAEAQAVASPADVTAAPDPADVKIEVPGGSRSGAVELPTGSDGLPGAESPDVSAPEVEVPDVEVPDSGAPTPGGSTEGPVELPGGSGRSSEVEVDVPEVEVPEPAVDVPDVSSVGESVGGDDAEVEAPEL